MTAQVVDTADAPDLNVRPEWGYRRVSTTSIPSVPRAVCAVRYFRPFADPGSRPPAHPAVNATDEAARVRAFLASAARQPTGLLIEGEPGIGKTTLWLAAHDEARREGFRVLSTRASAVESMLDFVGLDDLLGDVEPEAIEALSEPKREAIHQVLIRAGGHGGEVDHRSVAAAFTTIIEELAACTPVLIALDDVQWIDAATRDVLTYALRRVRGRVGIVVTERSVPDRVSAASWLDLGRSDRVTRLTIGPMPLGRLHRMMSSRTGRSFARPTLARIAEISGGNPYYALELANSLDADNPARTPVSQGAYSDELGLRVGNLDTDVHEVLLAAACVTTPSVDTLATVLQRSADQIVSLLEAPESLGLVAINYGRLHFSHPVLSHIVYSQARPADRRRIHRAVAAVEPILERQARHLALAATTGDPETLRRLDSAVDAACAKADPATAAELLELAIGLGGGTPARRVDAAHNHLLAGDIDRSLALLEPTVAELPAGLLRARARIVLAGALAVRGEFSRAANELREALADADEDPLLTVRIHLILAMTLSTSGDDEGADGHTQLARTGAEEHGNTSLISQALAAQVLFRCANGGGLDEVSLQRAIDMEQRHDSGIATAAPFSAKIVRAIVSSWTGRLTEARAQLAEALAYCSARGSDADILWVQSHAAMADIWLGRYSDAAQLADDMVLGAEQLGGILARVVAAEPRALIAALEGRESDARAEIALVPKPADDAAQATLVDAPRMVSGFLELSLGNHASALDALLPLLAGRSIHDHTEISACWFLPDLLEAAFSLGRIDEFEAWVNALETNGARLGRPWMVAVGARCRIMVFAARGELSAAEEAANRALEAHRALPMPFELGRTQLVVGQLRRRLRQKQAARDILGEALSTFEALGTPLWAARARAELSRAAAVTSKNILTPSELRVAELASSGLTNRDIASTLYISPKTVEHNLGRVYRKLGIRRRAELGRQIDSLCDGPG